MDTITLSSRMGTFTFKGDIRLSWAKLIRDAVTGQYFSPKGDAIKIRTWEDAHHFVKNYMVSRELSETLFEVVIRPKEL